MADIVQLEENGVMKYLKTHVSAVEGFDEFLKDALAKNAAKNTEVYNGGTFLNGETIITYDEKLLTVALYISVCLYDKATSKPLDRQFATYAIPAALIKKVPGLSHKLLMPDGSSFKFAYISPGKIGGNAENITGTNTNWCVRHVSVS